MGLSRDLRSALRMAARRQGFSAPLGPGAVLAAGSLLGLVSVGAALVPARLASRLDPAAALRRE